jgi:hypothetical protein
MEKLDKRSLAFGVLLAIIAQGIYDGILQAFLGNKIEVSAIFTAVVVTIGILLIMFYIFDIFGNSPYVTRPKKGTSLNDTSLKLQDRTLKSAQQQKTN